MEKEYDGDLFLLDRLLEYKESNMCWNKKVLTQEDIKIALNNKVKEQSQEFGRNYCSDVKNKPDRWHLGRVIYFINHPEEIKNIEVDNLCNGMYISPIPIIIDGNHRYMAAAYLKLEKIHCRYGGRLDVEQYLKGETDIKPEE